MSDNLEAWIQLFEQQKFAFVAYSGSRCTLNRSSWYRVPVGRWKVLRYQIERYGAEEVELMIENNRGARYDNRVPERTMFIRGYMAFMPQRHYKHIQQFPQQLINLCTQTSQTISVDDLQEIKSSDTIFANCFVFIVREAIPAGGKPYIPVEETFKYNYILEKQLCTSCPEEMQKLQFEMYELQEQHKKNVHCADVTIMSDVSKSCKSSSTTFKYIKPELDYICKFCKTYGHHLSESCSMWDQTETSTIEPAFKFGPLKFKQAVSTDASDSLFYKLLYQKTVPTKK